MDSSAVAKGSTVRSWPSPAPLRLVAWAIVVTAVVVLLGGATTAAAQSTEIAIESSVDGVDADSAPGPILEPGDTVTWNYLITVNGPATLYDLIVSDSSGLTPSCDIDGDGSLDGSSIHPGPLSAGQSFHCMASGTVEAAGTGTFSSVARVEAFDFDGAGGFIDTDRSHYTPVAPFAAAPGIDIQSLVNGIDADASPGPYIAEGAPLTWTYVVTNTGNVPLTDIAITNGVGAAVECAAQSTGLAGPLPPGASITCTSTVPAAPSAAGPQSETGAVTADAIDPTTGSTLTRLEDQDPLTYTPVELPQALAFTGPSDWAIPVGVTLATVGVALWSVAGALVRRRSPAAGGPIT